MRLERIVLLRARHQHRDVLDRPAGPRVRSSARGKHQQRRAGATDAEERAAYGMADRVISDLSGNSSARKAHTSPQEAGGSLMAPAVPHGLRALAGLTRSAYPRGLPAHIHWAVPEDSTQRWRFLRVFSFAPPSPSLRPTYS